MPHGCHRSCLTCGFGEATVNGAAEALDKGEAGIERAQLRNPLTWLFVTPKPAYSTNSRGFGHPNGHPRI